MNSTKTRGYSMANRADSAAETSRRILDSTLELYWQYPIEEITLAMIAERSGVTVQTVIRKFGGRDDVFTAAAVRTRAEVENQRNAAPVGDIDAIASTLVAHYEEVGDGVMKLLSEEHRLPAIAEIVERGRMLHRDWCARVFAPLLDGLRGAKRARRLEQFVAICDVYTWKIMRRDGKLSRAETETAIVEMIAALKGADQ
ncbi:MAG: TetR/AcrR family transcriptional regulator [Solirubrobacterales bacterium]